MIVAAILLLLLGMCIPIGLILGVYVGFKLLLWWLDKALTSDDDAPPPPTTP